MQPASGLPADEEPNFSGETQNSKQRKTTTIERARLGNQRGKSTIATGAQNSVAASTVSLTNSKAPVALAETSMTTEALPTDLAQEVPPDYLQSRCPASARDSLLEAMQAEKARVTAELGNLTAERVKPRQLPSLEISPKLATSPSLELSPKLATGAIDGPTQALVTVDARMGGKAPLPPLVAQREQPVLPHEHPSVEPGEQAKLQPGRLAPLNGNAVRRDTSPHYRRDSPPETLWRKAPMGPIGK